MFSDWWYNGDNVLINIYEGQIADDKNINDCMITNILLLNQLKDCICINLFKLIDVDDDFDIKNKNNSYSPPQHKRLRISKIKQEYFTETNKDDYILNNKININFLNEMIILIIGAQINSVIYNKIYECYVVTLSDKRVDKKFYSAALCKRFEGDSRYNKLKFSLLNKKPINLETSRPLNYNDEY